MILTVTPNTTLDLTVFIPSFVAGTTIRATQTYHSMGGKPTDASWILGRMGVKSHALGFAAGAVGNKVKNLLEEFDITTDFVEVDGETRINTVIVDEVSGDQTTITTNSMIVHSHHKNDLLQRYEATLSQASVVITGGSLPHGVEAGIYQEIIQLAHEAGVPTIFDASGVNLKVGLEASPTYIKPNHHELSGLVDYEINSLDLANQAGKSIVEKYGTQVIITMGHEGALALLKEATYWIPALSLNVKSAAGAGDAVLAGLAHAIHHNNPIEDGLRLGIATASAVCLHPATAAYEISDMNEFIPQIDLIPYIKEG